MNSLKQLAAIYGDDDNDDDEDSSNSSSIQIDKRGIKRSRGDGQDENGFDASEQDKSRWNLKINVSLIPISTTLKIVPKTNILHFEASLFLCFMPLLFDFLPVNQLLLPTFYCMQDREQYRASTE